MKNKVKVNLKTIIKKLQDASFATPTDEIGETIIKMMKNMMSKGISPIEGNGRFPAYKGVSSVNSLNEIRKGLLKDARSAREAKRLGEDGADSRSAGRAAKKAAKSLAQLKSKTYPYSVRDSFPDKRPRPVNLFLSGKFLRRLIARPKGKFVIEIGFFDSYGRDLEQGHRDGGTSKHPNSQPKRPIIPQPGEQFVNSIRLGIIKMIRQSVQEFLNGRR